MSKDRVVELINKLDYDKGVKSRFVSKLKKGLYDSHQSFMSTPLLSILMLLTYEQNANIPDKMHLFYYKAFETLFNKHDALKEQYDRSRKSNLQIDDFERVFSVFSLRTYALEKSEFTKSEIMGHLKEVVAYTKYDITAEDLLFDFEESICLLMREGQSYFFVHRSFQEYFTALFLANCPEDVRDAFIEKVSVRYWDSVLPMLFDMASDQIEPSWVVRETDKYLAAVCPDSSDKIPPYRARWGGLVFYKKDKFIRISTVTSGEFSKFILVMRRFYRQIESHTILKLEPIESYVTKNWESLCDGAGPYPNDSGNVSVLNIPFDKIPSELLQSSGLIEVANEEWRKIRELRHNVATHLADRNEFLKNLFSG